MSKEVEAVNACADILHVDVMDGVFVPNISVGFPVVEALSSVAKKPLDVHLMIVEPGRYALKFASFKGVGMVSFHLEACPEPEKLLGELRQAGVKAGLVINPDVPVESLFPYLDKCDYVLLMSVYAGFGGQKLIEETYDRIRCLKAEIERRGLDVEIEVDGGVTVLNAPLLTGAGADILVAGTAIFRAEDPSAAVAALR